MLKGEEAERAAGYYRVAGVDEAGRGPLAGPVVAAACIVPLTGRLAGVNDSKQLSPTERRSLYHQLTSDPSFVYAIGVVDHQVIDEVNILQATIRAMLQAVNGLALQPDLLLVDGLALPHPTVPARKAIRGDAEYYCIAAASILAKVHRDELMVRYHEEWPMYGFDQHKGYGTEGHRAAIEKWGPCPIHRLTFAPLKSIALHTVIS